MSRSAELVRSYQVRKNGPMVVVIPKPIREQLGIKKGTRFLVKSDTSGKLIYKPLD